jgi:hypothetical protein
VSAGPAFHAWGDRGTASLGLSGRWVRVSLEGEALALAGSDGGTLSLPIARIVALNAAAITAKNTRHLLELTLADPPGRIALVTGPAAAERGGYEAVVHALAASLLARGLPVTTGSGWFTAVFGLGSLGLIAAGLVVLAIVLAAEDGRTWWHPLPALVITLAVMAVVWRVARRDIPRPARIESDLARAFAWQRG